MLGERFRVRALRGACGALAAATAGLSLLAGGSPSAAASRLTPGRLSGYLAAGGRTTRVPADLNPPLQTAATAIPAIARNHCHLQLLGVRSRPCVYGDRRSTTSVVVFGDSHAAAWFPALALISKQQHWRLIDLTKAGCSPAEVNIRLHNVAAYPYCNQWRRNAQAQIAAIHPALVIVTWARWIEAPEARPLPGVPGGRGTAWADGVAAIFGFLDRSAGRVIFISDTPTLDQQAPPCVAAHPSDVFACTTSRSAAVRLPAVKQEELQLAHREHIPTIDPTSWFCTSTRCPVIVANLMVYRDDSHMTPAWSRFVAPVLAGPILRIMGGSR